MHPCPGQISAKMESCLTMQREILLLFIIRNEKIIAKQKQTDKIAIELRKFRNTLLLGVYV